MKYATLIAMRAGSKRFPDKHLALSQDRHVCELGVQAVLNVCPSIFIATDDTDVIDCLKDYPIKFFARSKTTATDSARVESAVREFLLVNPEIENLIFLPGANSCWLTDTDLKEAIMQYEITNAASLITLAPLKRYLYERTLHGWIMPLTLDTYRRGFLGNMPPVWIENGSFYIFNAAAFLKCDSFRIEPCTGFIMNKETERELDTPLDLAIITAVKTAQH